MEDLPPAPTPILGNINDVEDVNEVKVDEKQEVNFTPEDICQIWGWINKPTLENITKIFEKVFKSTLRYSKKEKAFYIYDEKMGLWFGGSDYTSTINRHYTSKMMKLFDVIEGNMGPKPPKPTKDTNNEDKRAYEEYYESLKNIKMVSNKVDSKFESLINKFLPDIYKYDEDIYYKLNQIDHLLPLNNGVWDFKQNKLLEYKREFYFSFKLGVNYNEKASTAGIEKLMNQWFKNDPIDVDFIQYWGGYSLTGYTSRKECLVIFGSLGNNGKSTFWEKMMTGILEMGKYFKNLNSEDISNGKSGNNDGLYELDGKRLARINEPREGFFNSLDNEIFKTIVGVGESVSAMAKFKTGKDFICKAKVVFTVNKIPKFNLEDKGVFNRVVLVEQNVPFVSKEEYDKAPAEDKEKGLIQMLDDKFLNTVMEDKEGVLLWLLKGAKKYMENPEYPVPEKYKEHKNEVKDEANELREWIQRWLEPSKGRNCNLSDIKQFWRLNDYDFGQKKVGFNKKFLMECEKLGYKTNAGRNQKSEERILDCKRLLTEKEEEAEKFSKPTVKS